MIKKIAAIALSAVLAIPVFASAANSKNASASDAKKPAVSEEKDHQEEAGYAELEKLMSTCDSMDIEGMSFEEISDAYIDNAMVEYLDGNTGFGVMYPAVLNKQIEGNVTGFTSDDGKASIIIEAIPADKSLSIKDLEKSILTENPKAKITNNETTGCFRSDFDQEDGTSVMDLYMSTDKWLHHVRYAYPKAQEETYGLYKDFIMNSMKTDELALG